MDTLTALLNEIRPGKDFARADDFFEQGVLDSLDLTTLVSELEVRYGVYVDIDEIVPGNFCNLGAIRAFLVRKGAQV
jgi:acyl carrier protein